jgi:hypothetical protein
MYLVAHIQNTNAASVVSLHFIAMTDDNGIFFLEIAETKGNQPERGKTKTKNL